MTLHARRVEPHGAAEDGAALRVVQRRAEATRDALLAAAMRLLRSRDFDQLSIAELAAEGGLSVGSFYGRFRDKEAFVALLQRRVADGWLAEGDRAFAGADDPSLPTARLIGRIAEAVVEVFRRDEGFVRASLRHQTTHPGASTPLQRAGRRFAEAAADVLAPRLAHLPPAQRRLRVRFALQVVYGTCMNAVLNDPGPIRLAERRMARELARTMAGYLQVRD